MKKDYKIYLLAAISLIVLFIVVKVINMDNAIYEIYLNGNSDETYLVNQYVDNGALALKDKVDISNLIIRESNIEQDKPGDYEIYYSIYGKSHENEYKVKRNIHIIDLKVIRKVNRDLHMIYLSILSDNYSYTILPDDTHDFNKEIAYQYTSDGEYNFEVVLDNNLSKLYKFRVFNYDKDAPEASCILKVQNNSVNYQIDAYDDSGISKYVINNNEYVSDNISIPLEKYQSKNVRIYDTMGNYTDITCKADLDSSFKEIVPSSEKNGYIKCNSNTSFANEELNKIIDIYGDKTRNSVVAAALYLTNYPYKISYTWGGKSLSFGINSNWGCSVTVTENKCTNPLGGNTCEAGLDCTGFTSWAFYQAGFSKDIIRTSSQSTGNWGNFNAYNHRYSFTRNHDKVSLIKIGDIVHTEGHVGMVIGISDDTLQVANMVGPIIITVIKKSNGQSINGQHSFDNFVLFDEFYQMYGK